MHYVPIKLDKVRNFGYGMRACYLIEKKLKKPISQIDFENLRMEDLAVVFWAGLVHEDKNLTPDKVMDLVDQYSSLKEVSEAMQEAFAAFAGEDELQEAGQEKN
jgi:hypothetical protein